MNMPSCPSRFCRNLSVCGSSGLAFFSMFILFIATYYLPLCTLFFSHFHLNFLIPLAFSKNSELFKGTQLHLVVCDCEPVFNTQILHGLWLSLLVYLPYLLGTVVCAALAGVLVSRTRQYWHVIFLSPALGFGLMYMFSPTTPDSRIIGYQVWSKSPNNLTPL